MINRRKFIAATAAGVALRKTGAQEAADPKQPICVFTKPLQSLSYDQLADRIAELGFDGIEATIRDGGHIEPAAVPDELPKMVEALRQNGLEITVMTSSINDANHPHTEPVLRTAAKLGIKRYRLKYLQFDLKKPIRPQLVDMRRQLQELASLNRQIGIRGVYQNHAGNKNLGATIWDLAEVLRDISADDLAVAYDIRHATVEGGTSWPLTFQMIRPHIDTVYVKDFIWADGDRPINVPLGEGRISRKFFQMLSESDFHGPISLHEEYLDHRQPELVPEHLAAMKRDFATLTKWLAG